LFTMLTKSATNILYNFDTVLTLRHMLKSVLNHFLSYIEKGQWYLFLQINVRESRRDKQEWTIQRMRQQWVHYNPENAATVGTLQSRKCGNSGYTTIQIMRQQWVHKYNCVPTVAAFSGLSILAEY
jgi:hypothetical protein